MKIKQLLVLFVCISLVFSGCAATMALKQPSKKNLTVLNSGTSRDNVITFLGAPVSSDIQDGKKTDIYQFEQGYSGRLKAARATGHILADLATLFIWELIGMPIEAIADGHTMTIKVNYDENDKVKDFTYLQQPEA